MRSLRQMGLQLARRGSILSSHRPDHRDCGGRTRAKIMEWNIQSRAAECCGCHQAYANKQPYHTLLYDEKLGYVRLDVCETCWQSQYSQGATSRKGFVSHWQGVFEVPQPKPELIRKETAETLLRKLVEANDPEHAASCYILAVMLERKRLLKIKDEIHADGRRVFIYEQPKSGDIFTIADPELGLDQLEQVQRDVTRLLHYGITPPNAGNPPSEPDTPSDPAPDADLNPSTEPEPETRDTGPTPEDTKVSAEST